jgi:hypothetical protein
MKLQSCMKGAIQKRRNPLLVMIGQNEFVHCNKNEFKHTHTNTHKHKQRHTHTIEQMQHTSSLKSTPTCNLRKIVDM